MSVNLSWLIEPFFADPVMQPTSIVVAFLLLYWGLVALGTVDVEFLDWDFELSIEADGGFLDIGLVPIRFLNLGTIPVMIWVTIFSLSAWILSLLIHGRWAPDQTAGVVLAEACGMAALATKLITNPMRPIFDTAPPNLPETLIGKSCVVTSGSVTGTVGEASYATGQAPLILTVRSNSDEQLDRGQTAVITDYRAETNTYLVEAEREETI
jgi:hypothetical protein